MSLPDDIFSPCSVFGASGSSVRRNRRWAWAWLLVLFCSGLQQAFAQDLPTLSAADASADETAAAIDFVVKLSASASDEVTVDYATSNGTAVSGEDYEATSGTLTFAAGTMERTVSVSLVNDALDELAETLNLTLSNPSGATLDDAVGTGTIEDNDVGPELYYEGAFGLELEEGEEKEFRIWLIPASGRTVTVNYETQPVFFPGRATAAASADDFVYLSGTLTFAPGETNKTLRVRTVEDGIYEPRWTSFFVRYEDLQGGATFYLSPWHLDGVPTWSTGFVIEDNEPIPDVVIPDAAGLESAGSLAFPVTLTGPVESAVSMQVSTGDGTAVAGEDYAALTDATLSFGSLETSQTIRVAVTDDDVAESGSETFTVRLRQTDWPFAGNVDDLEATGTILDDDMEPVLYPSNAMASEGDGQLPFTVTLGGGNDSEVTVNYATADGTAVAGQDYTATSGTLTFAAGETEMTVAVTLLDDARHEDSEAFSLRLSGAVGASLGIETATGTIFDDEMFPTLYLQGSQSAESGFLDYAVTISPASSAPVSADYHTARHRGHGAPAYRQADPHRDYTPRMGSLTIEPGETSTTIRVPVLEDQVDEPVEAVVLTLQNVVNANFQRRLGSSMCPWDECTRYYCCACSTILDDDLARMSIRDASAPEDAARLSFQVSLAEPAVEPVSVTYATSDATAMAGADYEAASGSLTIPAGSRGRTIEVFPLDDEVFEPTETFTVTLSDPVNAEFVDAEGTGTITDNDSLEFSVAGGGDVEGGTVDFVVTLAGVGSATATVDYATSDDTALAGEDYEAASGTLTFEPGDSSRTVSVSLLDDSRDEPEEAFTLTLTSATIATIASGNATGTIADNDDAPGVSIGDAAGPEGGEASFAVTLDTASGQEVTVAYATADGTALGSEDYEAAAGVLRFAVGETELAVPVSLTTDGKDEPRETFTVSLSSPTNATLATAAATGTIEDADDPPTLSVEAVSGVEGGTAQFTVRLDAASSFDVRVNYATRDGTALAGEDYEAMSGTLSFAPGERAQTVTVPLTDDVVDEPEETFTLALSAPANATIGTETAEATIADNDDPPVLSVAGGSGVEGGTLAFDVTLVGSSSEPVTVSYATSDGTAVVGEDYEAASGTLTFEPGETSQTVTVPLTDDAVHEPAETFAITLSSPMNATLDTVTADGTIVDDDGAPQLSIDGTAGTEGGTLEFDVTLVGSSSEPATVDYATSDDTALAGEDYEAASGTLTFGPGETSQSVTVALLDDLVHEPAETFTLALSSPEQAELAVDSAIGRIADNDDLPAFSVADGSGREGSVVEFVVSLAGAASEASHVDYATTDDTAVAGEDYEAVAGTLTFEPGETEMTVPVTLLEDGIDDPDETFALQLRSPENATLAMGDATGAIVDIDDLPMLSVADGSGVEGGTVAFAVTLAGSTSRTVTVAYATADGSAVTGIDYRPARGVLTFAPGESRHTVEVALLDDAVDEPDETFTLMLSSVEHAELADAAGRGTIVDDDEPELAALWAADATGIEGDGELPFTVRLGAAAVGEVTVDYATADGTAVAGEDYEAAQGTLTLMDGESAGMVSVTLLDDEVDEPRETFSLRLFSPTNATLSANAATGTIIDDDEWLCDAPSPGRVLLFEPSLHAHRQGFVRIVNHSPAGGEVRVEAIDNTGVRYGPVALSVGAGAATHFNSDDLEAGNADKGLPDGIGVSGEGAWRLELTSELDIEVLSYMRTRDGFVTSLHDTAPATDGVHRAVFLNPGGNVDQVSRLRLINPGAVDAMVTVTGTDDMGQVSPAVLLSVPAGQAREWTAVELEAGVGADGALGNGQGKWRLSISSDRPVTVLSLIENPTGHLTNLSTLPQTPGRAPGSVLAPLFPSAADALGRQGFVRVMERSGAAQSVRIEAFDRSGFVYEPLTLALDAEEVKSFNSNDLELGNAANGLTGSTGSGQGDWWLELSGETEIGVGTYVRTADGFVTPVHDLVPEWDGSYRVVFFNPAENPNQVSVLWLVNPGDADAQVTIKGVDDRGASPGTAVRTTVAAGSSRRLTSVQLETGESAAIDRGALGDGVGKWRLRVESDRMIRVMSLIENPTGHLTNLSTAPDCRPPADGASGP